MRYSRSGSQGTLTIEQPGKNHTTTIGNTKYRWDLQLNKKVPVDLSLHFGAGQARLDLASLDLRGVSVDMGVGQLDMDLRSMPKHSYTVAIHGGIGQATVRLPADAGIYAEAHGGIGSISVRGLHHEDGHWESPVLRPRREQDPAADRWRYRRDQSDRRLKGEAAVNAC